MRASRWAIAIGAVLWAASLPLAAYAASQPSTGSPSSFFALGVYAIGSVICHQRPERSYQLWSAQLPVCARCTGIYLGAALGAIFLMSRPIRRTPDPTSRVETALARTGDPGSAGLSRGQALAAIVLAAVPALFSLGYESLTGDTPSNNVRACTGVLLGVVAAWLVLRQALR